MNIYQYLPGLLISHKPVIFELGGHDGDTANKLNKLIQSCVADYEYYVFEPDPRVRQSISNVAGKFKQVTFIPKAVGDRAGKTVLYLSDGHDKTNGTTQWYNASSSTYKPTEHLFNAWSDIVFDEQVEVDIVTLDDFWSGGIIDFIWSDIQGAELAMIKGGQKTLANTRYLFTEYNNERYYEQCPNLNEIMEALPGWTIVYDFGGDALLRNEVHG
ncbi:MAG TPA: FkbM family methyltransferase [Planctomycetes bacterium]|nr:FkbM family methyltransferase [Planctomycetota bacterium]